MSWICECGKPMKCMETRRRESMQYRRYKCVCGVKMSTNETLVDDPVRNNYFNTTNFETWKDSMMARLLEGVQYLEKAGKTKPN